MQFKSVLSIAVLGCFSLFFACKNDEKAAKDVTLLTEGNTTAPEAANPAATPAPATATPEPPQNAAGVWHYTCTKGCAGGAGAAVACATCNATLVHNPVYHGKPAAAGDQAGAPGQAPAPKAAEPPQNAAGVWHFTCPKGCAGGAGAATPCATCGTKLEHNKAYH